MFFLPFCIISSLVLVKLVSKVWILYQMKYGKILSQIDDENEIIFCEYDLKHVWSVINRRKSTGKACLDGNKKKMEVKEYILSFFSKLNIYEWHENFKFTSRFLNTIIVSILTLYYFVVCFNAFIHKNTEPFLNDENSTETIRFYLLIIKSYFDNADDNFDLKNFNTTVYNNNTKLEEFDMRTTLYFVLVSPLFLASATCFLHLFLFVRECQKNLVDSYKGKCDLINSSRKKFSNTTIARSSFKFGG
jgi:hypothetical protein